MLANSSASERTMPASSGIGPPGASAGAGAPLPPPGLEKRPPGRHAQLGRRGLEHPVEPDLVLDLRPLVGPVILGGVQPAGIPIDGQRDLRNVAVIDPKGLDPLAAGPLGEVLEPFGQPAAKVADLVGSRAAGFAGVGRRLPGRVRQWAVG